MMETTIQLKPVSEWRRRETWWSSWSPEWARGFFRRFAPDHMSTEELVNEMNEALKIPGTSNAWTMPIKNRIDMLTTGVRTPVGVKIFGADTAVIERIGMELETVLPRIRGTRNVFAERTGGGYFLDFDWNRDEMARYGVSIDDVQAVVTSAVGGEGVTTTVEGRERYSVNVRYMRDYRNNVNRLERVMVPVMGGQTQVPVSQLGKIKVRSGPGHDARRERHAERLRVRRCGGPRCRKLRRRREGESPEPGRAAAGLLDCLERPI